MDPLRWRSVTKKYVYNENICMWHYLNTHTPSQHIHTDYRPARLNIRLHYLTLRYQRVWQEACNHVRNVAMATHLQTHQPTNCPPYGPQNDITTHPNHITTQILGQSIKLISKQGCSSLIYRTKTEHPPTRKPTQSDRLFFWEENILYNKWNIKHSKKCTDIKNFQTSRTSK